MAKVITIVEDDRAGLLLDISYVLGKERINIESIAATTVGGKAIITLQVKDPKRVKDLLRRKGFNVEEESFLFIKLPDKPGELAKITKLLADNKVNLLNLYVVARDGKHTVIALQPDRIRKARNLLKEWLVEEELI